MITKSDLRAELAPIKANLRILTWMSGLHLAVAMTVLFLLIKHQA